MLMNPHIDNDVAWQLEEWTFVVNLHLYFCSETIVLSFALQNELSYSDSLKK